MSSLLDIQQMKLLGFFLFIGVAFGLPAPQACKNQVINVNSDYSLPLTVGPSQNCDISFVVPTGSYAVLNLKANNVGEYDSIYINDKFGGQARRFVKGESTFSSNQAWPGSVDINFQTQSKSNMNVEITVTVKKATPQANIVSKVNAATNSPSTVIYFQNVVEGTSYTFNSATKLDIKTTYLADNDPNQLGNIFVYDGGVLVGSLLKENLSVKSNQVILYVAKKPVNIRGAVLATDKSNVDKYAAHYLSYVPVDRDDNISTHLIKGDEKLEGAFTVIGDSDGSTPIDVLAVKNLDDLNGQFTFLSGGPVANHAQASPVKPSRIPGSVTTFYLSRGRGTLRYSTPGK